MRLFLTILVMLSSTISFTKTASQSSSKKDDAKTIKRNFLKICEEGAKEKISIARNREICRCSLKHILTQVGIEDLKIMTQKPPEKLPQAKTTLEKKRNKKLIMLSDLYIHSIDDCFRATAPQKK